MGHAVEYDTFEVTVSKDEIFSIVNERAICEGNYHTPLNNPIRWHDNLVLNSYDEAVDYIDNHDFSYGQIAVKYKHQNDFKPSKTLVALKERAAKARREHYELNNAYHFKNHKSATIGCKKCGSKISLEYHKKYHKNNVCPVCREDLRPASTLERIAALKKKEEDLSKQCYEREKAERMKSISKATTYWLVKTEFHV